MNNHIGKSVLLTLWTKQAGRVTQQWTQKTTLCYWQYEAACLVYSGGVA